MHWPPEPAQAPPLLFVHLIKILLSDVNRPGGPMARHHSLSLKPELERKLHDSGGAS